MLVKIAMFLVFHWVCKFGHFTSVSIRVFAPFTFSFPEFDTMCTKNGYSSGSRLTLIWYIVCWISGFQPIGYVKNLKRNYWFSILYVFQWNVKLSYNSQGDTWVFFLLLGVHENKNLGNCWAKCFFLGHFWPLLTWVIIVCSIYT